MSFGKLYGYHGHPRTQPIIAVAKENGLDIELVETNPAEGVSADYLTVNKLGKIPTFVGADGYNLSECIAIAVYVTSQNEKTTLLGKTKQDYASILRWMSFGNSEVIPKLAGWFLPLIGRAPYNKKTVEDAQAGTLKTIKVLEEHLTVNTYLVSERLTLADIFVASMISRGFQFFFDPKWRSENPATTRWFQTVVNQPIWTAVSEPAILATEPLKNVAPPKKEAPKKEVAPKKEAPKAAAAEEPAPAPKPKHPLEALGRPSLAIDDWKRKYSNEDTREGAMPWFWDNVNFEEYSIWAVDYKYNDELTMTFMSSNLIGGLFARLEASRKYLFGVLSVYGVTNDSVIKGAFLVRGQEAIPAFDVAPDHESYSFTKLDPKSETDRKFVEDQWACDKGIEVNGKTYEWADGKVFK